VSGRPGTRLQDPAGPQLTEIGEPDTGERVHEVGLGGADAGGRSLGAGVENAAVGHGAIVGRGASSGPCDVLFAMLRDGTFYEPQPAPPA
jgi:hypothetical protein